MAQIRTLSNYLATQSGPHHYDFAGGDGQVTVGEKRASVRGQMSRGTLGSTTGRDRCKRGKACGVTCIAANEDCIIDFPEPVQGQLQKMAQFILDRRTKEGRAISEEEDIELGKGVGALGRHLTRETLIAKPGSKTGEKVETRAFPTKESWGVKQALHAREIIDLKNRRDEIGDAQNQPSLLRAWQQDVQKRGLNLKKDDLEALYDSLPVAAQRQLANSGNPNRKAGDAKWYGVDKDGNGITNGKSATKARGLAVLDMYLKQGGTDAYSSNTSRVFSPADLDVEHIKPVSKGGLDHPDNWVLARAGAQRLRADQHLGEWIDSLPNNRTALQDYVSLNERKTRTRKAIKKMSEEVYNNRKSMSDEDWNNITLEKRIKIDTLPSGTKIKSPVKEAVKEYMFLSPNGDKDRFLGGSFLRNPDQTPGAAKGLSAPQGWKQAYAMYHKDHSYDEAIAFRSKVKDVWDGYTKRGEYGVEEATTKVKKLFEDSLTPNQLRIVGGNLDKANRDLVKKYSGVGGTEGSLTPRPSPKAMDELLASIRAEPAPVSPKPSKVGEGTPKRAAKATTTKKAAAKPVTPAAPVKTASEKAAAQRAGVIALINNFRGQGMTDAQIANQLRTLRVPGPLIADLLA
jgi:hypothetical protein